MLFWVLVGLVVAATLFVFIYNAYWDDSLIGLMLGVATLLVGGLLTLLTLTIVNTFPVRYVIDEHTDEYKLQALATGSEISGRLYLLGGYVGENPSFRYLLSDGGGYVLRSIDAEDAVVFEGDHSPRLEDTVEEWGNPWIQPWTTEGHSYAFYVPEGSISSDISVAP